MVAFSFNRRFVQPIEARTKILTIRKLRKRNARVGDSLQFSHGSRFKPVRFGYAVCIASGRITLDLKRDRVSLFVTCGGQLIDESDALDLFAIADGFANWADLKVFWRDTHAADVEFHGWLTAWNDTFVTAAEHDAGVAEL